MFLLLYHVHEYTINLLDFGCIRIFNPNFVRGVIKLYRALLHDNKDEAAKAYKSWGFKNLNSNLINALNVWALYLYGPLLEDKITNNQDEEILLLNLISLNNKKWTDLHPEHMKLVLKSFKSYKNSELLKLLLLEIFRSYKIL